MIASVYVFKYYLLLRHIFKIYPTNLGYSKLYTNILLKLTITFMYMSFCVWLTALTGHLQKPAYSTQLQSQNRHGLQTLVLVTLNWPVNVTLVSNHLLFRPYIMKHKHGLGIYLLIMLKIVFHN